MSVERSNGGRTASRGGSEGRSDKGQFASGGHKADNVEPGEVTQKAGALASEAWESGNALFDQAAHLVGTLQRGHGELGEQLAGASATRPYVAIGAAAGLGFVLGGGLTFGLTRRLIGLGGRYAVSMAMRRLMQAAAASA